MSESNDIFNNLAPEQVQRAQDVIRMLASIPVSASIVSGESGGTMPTACTSVCGHSQPWPHSASVSRDSQPGPSHSQRTGTYNVHYVAFLKISFIDVNVFCFRFLKKCQTENGAI